METDPGPPAAAGDRAASVGLGAAAALVLAVALAVDPWGLRPFTTVRWALVGVCAAVAGAALWWRPPRAVAVVGGLLLGWLALATATAPDPLTALVGHPRRHLGLAGWVVGGLALLAGTGLADRSRTVGRAAVAGALATGAAGIADVAGWDPFGARFAGGRAGGLLGQPLYLAVVALLLAPVAAGVALDRRERGAWRVTGACGAAGSAAALAASQTRGAWFGAVVAVAALAASWRARDRTWADPPGQASRTGAAVGVQASPAGAAVGVRASRTGAAVVVQASRAGAEPRDHAVRAGAVGADGIVPQQVVGEPAGGGLVAAPRPGRLGSPVVSLGGRPVPVAFAAVVGALAVGALLLAAAPRLAAATDPDAPGGRGRLDEWALAVRVVADHPLTGVGPEGYRIAAPAHIDDGYTLRHGRDEVVDRAHSAPLDLAAAGGLPAALSYVGLVGIVVVRCVRVIGRRPDPVLAGAAAAVVGWSAQQVVGFPIAEVDPLAWLLAGMVVASPSADAVGRARSRAPRGRVPARVGRPAAALLAAVLTVVGLTAVLSDRDLARADAAVRRGDVATALARADRATDRRPDDVDAWYLAARVAATPDGLPAIDNALDRVEAGLDHLPADPALRQLHTDLLVDRALRSGLPDDVAVATASA